jgi:hypothetical protein
MSKRSARKCAGAFSPVYVLLNGAFGIGKTTVATLLEREIPGARLHNPEDIGFVLRRLPPFLLGLAAQPADYQDLKLWRTLAARGARRAHRRAPVVIVPMAFTNLAYLDAFAETFSADGEVRRFCLVATSDVVTARLEKRARSENRAVTEFEARRSADCIAAHADPAFGIPIDAARSPAEIVADIRTHTEM